jgi:hypothetical protein
MTPSALAPALAPAAPGPAAIPFLQQRAPIAIILGSFVLLTVPMALMDLLGANELASTIFFRTYHILFSITHFFLTLWLYFDARNVAYFTSSARTRLIYFAAPIAILVGVAALGFFRVDPVNGDYEPTGSFGPMMYAFLFAFIVRALDYRHSTRQSFGVLQLIKAQPGAKYPSWSKTLDNGFFAALFVLELLTFTYGGHFTATPLMLASIGVTAAIGVGVLAGFVRAARGMANPRALLAPLAYLLFQTSAACLVVYRFELYAISLAMHFTEYHVVMAPRCFERVGAAGGAAGAAAGAAAAGAAAGAAGAAAPGRKVFLLRRNWIAAYAVLILLSLAYYVSYFMDIAGVHSESQVVWAMTNMFNGIFLAHFFVESFVWRFSTPHYRNALAPVFFPRRA